MAEQINNVVMAHELATSSWQFHDIGKKLYEFYPRINERFFDAKVPTPVISFKRERRTHAGHYVPGRNEIGVLDNININSIYLGEGLAEILATLTHELAHSWQKNQGKPGKHNFHNQEFQNKMRSIGLPCDKRGRHLGMTEPFLGFLKEYGVTVEEKPPLPEAEMNPDKSGGSRLKPWTCGCPGYGPPSR